MDLEFLLRAPLRPYPEHFSSFCPLRAHVPSASCFSDPCLSLGDRSLEARTRRPSDLVIHGSKPVFASPRRLRVATCAYGPFSNGDLDSSSHVSGDHLPPLRDQDSDNLEASAPPENKFFCANKGLYVAQKGCSPMKGVGGERQDSMKGDIHCVGGHAAEVGIPLSLKMLKRRQGREKFVAGLANVGNSLREAFSSMVFMMKTLQSHTLHIRRQLFYEEVEGLLNLVQREMYSSFLWLFQQVFACTPKLMVLVMILLVDFTVYSMGTNLALADISSPRPVSSMVSNFSHAESFKSAVSRNRSSHSFRAYLDKPLVSSPALKESDEDFPTDSGWAGNGGGRNYAVAGGSEDDPRYGETTESRAMYLEEETVPSGFTSITASVALEEYGNSQTQPPPTIGRGLNDRPDIPESPHTTEHCSSVILDQETMHNLVAPVSVQLEGDNYLCYDRTDLSYQHEIAGDSTNSLLLANYAQFLFLVRHDYNRAEELFRRALVADPSDSEVIGRFASFLWLARCNVAAAEKAYRAAVTADPSSSFHAANYAYFLWHLGQ